MHFLLELRAKSCRNIGIAMALSSPKLKWCTVRLGQDMNWWVDKTSDPIHWDTVDGLSILDPRQVGHIIEAADQLVAYGFQLNVLNRAFYKFHVLEDLGKGKVKLERVQDSLIDSSEPLFALPDMIDEEKGPYADLLHQVTQARVKMLNDVIEFEQHITIEELEEEIREHQNEEYMEGKAVHAFSELTLILEYVPHGYEIDEDDETPTTTGVEGSPELDEEFPDLEEEELEKDETMRWEEDEKEDEDEEEDLDLPGSRRYAYEEEEGEEKEEKKSKKKKS